MLYGSIIIWLRHMIPQYFPRSCTFPFSSQDHIQLLSLPTIMIILFLFPRLFTSLFFHSSTGSLISHSSEILPSLFVILAAVSNLNSNFHCYCFHLHIIYDTYIRWVKVKDNFGTTRGGEWIDVNHSLINLKVIKTKTNIAKLIMNSFNKDIIKALNINIHIIDMYNI